MNSSLSAGSPAFPGILRFAAHGRNDLWNARTGADDRALDTMPRERLEDMGIAPRTEANFRSSGQTGPIPGGQY